jgi:hypothetical protein
MLGNFIIVIKVHSELEKCILVLPHELLPTGVTGHVADYEIRK